MPAHFEIRENDGQEWVALVGGNGQTIATTETTPTGHGNAMRALDTIVRAAAEASTQPIHTPDGLKPWTT